MGDFAHQCLLGYFLGVLTITYSQDATTDINAKYVKLECRPMPNVMVALPNTGGALCSTPQSLADAHY